MNFIGEKLETVISYLKSKGITYEIQDNNFSVEGDTWLVTNFVLKDNFAKITVGSFIFDVQNKSKTAKS